MSLRALNLFVDAAVHGPVWHWLPCAALAENQRVALESSGNSCFKAPCVKATESLSRLPTLKPEPTSGTQSEIFGNAVHAVRTQCEVLDIGEYSHPSYLLVVKH